MKLDTIYGWTSQEVSELEDYLSTLEPEELQEEIERITQIGMLKKGINYVGVHKRLQ